MIPFTAPEDFEEYRIVRPIGQGAMGQVFLAEDTLLCRPVAIKFVAGEPDDAVREQFFVEARAIARLSHPNVVAIYRVGEIRRRPYLVSEYVRGETLDKLERPLRWERLLAVSLGLARGLSAAHRRGVLHRDLKPANVMVAESDEVKLLDFGLARLVDDARGPRGEGPVGSPLYIPPEIWRGEPARPASDLYSVGIILFELAAGRTPFEVKTVSDIMRASQERDPPPLASVAIGIDRRFAAIVDRCLLRDPALRPASADVLRDALEELSGAGLRRGLPPGNPYRGLLPFDAEHRGLFFGRDAEVSTVLERLRVERFVLVSGDSGAGKSSLCRAGVVPLAEERCGFRAAAFFPGKHPVAALASALLSVLEGDEVEVAAALRADPAALAARLRAGAPEGLLLFVDQLEEVCTVSDAGEARAFTEALGALLQRVHGVRLLATARGDFLARLAAQPGLGEAVGRAIYLLPPPSADAMREVIVGPARAKGVRFESSALIESLIDSSGGGLPFLQFALSALWEERDHAQGVIPAAALSAIGGVDGALARHADSAIDQLLPAERTAARRLLCRLVTSEGTRIRRLEGELLPAPDGAASAALEALVRARLLVAHQGDEGEGVVYEIAHEALITGWERLRGWLADDAEARALRQRIERAASDWERLRYAKEALFGARQLAEVAALELGELGPRDAAFLAASRGAARRRRVLQGSLSVLAALLVASAFGIARWKTRRDLAVTVGARVAAADEIRREAERRRTNLARTRAAAMSLFDDRRWSEAEEAWQAALDVARGLNALDVEASSLLEGSLVLDPADRGVRGRLADTLYERVLLAESFWRRDQAAELSARLAPYDDGGARLRRLDARAGIALETDPAGAAVTLALYAEVEGRLVLGEARPLGVTPLARQELAPGSYLFTLTLPGRAIVRAPMLLGRGEELALSFTLPRAADVPPGFVYVPPGRFLFGSHDDEEVRRGFLRTVPLHEITTGAYLIGRTEVTLGEWLTYLAALPADERRRRTPMAQSARNSLEIRELAGGGYHLAMRPTHHTYEADQGEPVRYLERDRRAVQEWTRFPVAAVSYDDASAYAAWLDRTGRVPGARLCDEREWERAARGADGRTFPAGERLAPDDANFDKTYGRRPLGFGPDEVGTHPGSRSPFGVEDLAGNVWEWMRSVGDSAEECVYRGGSWYQGELSSRSANREVGERTTRHPFHGVRICAAAPPLESPRASAPEAPAR